jgi:hypothetical protein
MLILSTTSQRIQCSVVSGTATLGASASYVDINATTNAFVGVAGVLLADFTTTTQIVDPPASGNARNVKHLVISNEDASNASTIIVWIYDATNTCFQWRGTLASYERVILDECGTWTYYAADGTRK